MTNKPDNRGRKPALSSMDAARVRNMYRRTSCSMDRLAAHFKVSQGTIAAAINKTGPYQTESRDKAVDAFLRNAAGDD